VQRITRYPLLIKQILQYTEPDQDRELTERALHTAERILNTINEAIREQEGHDRLKALSQDLWIGQGYVPPTQGFGYIRAYYLQSLQAAGSDSADAAPRRQETAKRGTS
jgi:GAF domain-containing protein